MGGWVWKYFFFYIFTVYALHSPPAGCNISVYADVSSAASASIIWRCGGRGIHSFFRQIQSGFTALMRAIQSDHTACAHLLLESGADKDTKSNVRFIFEMKRSFYILYHFSTELRHWHSVSGCNDYRIQYYVGRQSLLFYFRVCMLHRGIMFGGGGRTCNHHRAGGRC